MKKITTLFCFCLFSTIGLSQSTLANNNFEYWTDVVVKDSFEFWRTSNEQLAQIYAGPNVWQSAADPQDGLYSVYLETVFAWNEGSMEDDTVFGYIIKENAPGGTFEGFPYTDTVDVLTFWYKCDVMPGDSAICLVELRKAGAAYSTNIYKMGGTVSTWTEVTLPLMLGATEEPDSVFIAFASSDPMTPGVAEEGSMLEVDFVNFEFTAGSTTPSAIPNNSFESLIETSAALPDDWYTFNDIALLFVGQEYIAQSADASVGTSAIEITTTAENVANDIPSVVTNGWFDFALDNFAGGTPFIAQPDVFSYDLKYAPAGTDTFFMWLSFWNDLTGSLIDTFDIVTASPTYTTRTINLTFTEAPDSVFVLFYSGLLAGTVALVDNIQFTGGDIGFGSEPLFSELRVHPNPANGSATLLFDKADEIEIVNIAGQRMYHTANVENGKLTIDTNDWDGGVYFVRVNNNGKMLTKKLIVSH